LHCNLCDCNKTSITQGFPYPEGGKSGRQSVAAKGQVTRGNSAISAPFWITLGVKILSQMNPLSESGVSGILLRGNPG
jgi:hypothetical protein